ncbi:hypothetical protein OJ997_24400 [Solirubrobacter phytolaccae]|uniref:Uncharacterized protein n=1 Tax=Solirubrobacter phytolaccae TaxID=1404360 RepID=A0A9X3NEH7_9ACTN|nr:hypothetical protein [Solirubrobacter phytolaccae]MDA0183472.1 hypothetical protein [Solirubrobacter phytolaccae]
MPRQLAEIMAEYAEHEASRFSAPDAVWEPTVFTRDDAGHVRAHEFREPDDDSATRRVQGIVVDSRAAVTGLLLMVFRPEQLLVTTTDGATHIAAKAPVVRALDGPPQLADWEEVTPGDEVATFAINLLRSALGQDTLSQRAGALEELSMIRRALDGFIRRVDADGHLRLHYEDEVVLEADRLALVELARDALDLAVSRGRVDKQIDDGFTLKRVPTPPADLI